MLIASLVIATCGLSTVLIINNSAKQSYANNNTLLLGNVQYQVVSKNPQLPLTKQDYAALRRNGFSELIAIAQSSTHLYQNKLQISTSRIIVTGIDTMSLLPLMNNMDSTNMPQLGQAGSLLSMPFSKAVGIVHPNLLKQLNVSNINIEDVSQRLYLSSNAVGKSAQDSSGNINKATYLPDLVTHIDPSLGNDLITDIGEYFRLFSDGKLSSLLVITQYSDEALQTLVSTLETSLPEHLHVVSVNNGNQQGELADSFHMNLLAMALLMFVVCLFIVINAVNLLLNSRMPWFKICRQLGISRYQIFTCQIVEIGLIAFIASCVGIFTSIHFSNLITPTVQATLNNLFGVQVGYGNRVLFTLFFQVFSISLVGSIVATIAPFWASNQGLNSIHSNIVANNSLRNWHKLFWLSCAGFALASLLILSITSQLWLLLVATALLILSGCCLLLANYPIVINILYGLIPRRFVMLQLSTKQSIALSGKTKVACCAFFIAATSNIGMNLMVDSFRGATISWLETRLTTDYYLYYDGKQDIQLLADQAEVEVFQRYEKTLNYKGQTIRLHSYPTTLQFQRAMVFDKVNTTHRIWQAFEAGKAIFVNQQFAFTYNYTLGDEIVIPHPVTNVQTNYSIQGVYYDFGNPYKQVLLPLSSFNTTVPSGAIYSINADASGITRFETELVSANIDIDGALFSAEELLQGSADTFDRTFVITDGLNIVTLLVAALSLACAIIVLMDNSRPQNMLIRSLGVSTFKTQGLALFQYALLCIVALLFATPFGILLSWVLIYKINLQAFQWTYPLQIDVLKIGLIYVVSLTVVIAVIVFPIIKASKRPLIEDIRWLN